MKKKRIAIFASGSGSNAQKIIEHFAFHRNAEVCCLLSNNPGAYALSRADRLGVETRVFSRKELYESSVVDDYLTAKEIRLIVLAGFLWLIPEKLIHRFPIINIHPALLPEYGGKNMYGKFVHEAVIRNGEEFSGITIHYVNERYDEGKIIFQARCKVEPSDTPDTLAEKIHLLEHEHYPRIVEQIILGL